MEERISHEANLFLRKDVSDPRLLFVSITRTELNADSSVAKIYWDTFDAGKRGDVAKALKGSLGKMRTHLASILKIRHVPSLVVEYDARFDSEQHIQRLLDEEGEKGEAL